MDIDATQLINVFRKEMEHRFNNQMTSAKMIIYYFKLNVLNRTGELSIYSYMFLKSNHNIHMGIYAWTNENRYKRQSCFMMSRYIMIYLLEPSCYCESFYNYW